MGVADIAKQTMRDHPQISQNIIVQNIVYHNAVTAGIITRYANDYEIKAYKGQFIKEQK